MDLFWIKESIINFFQAQSEKVNIMNLNFDNLLYWIGVNPFTPSTSLFILIWIFITFIWIIIWVVHIFDNLKNYNTTKTIKKTFLLLLFVLLNMYVLLNIPWLQKYTFIDMSLIYTKWNTILNDKDIFVNDDTSSSTMNETWYKTEVLTPKFSNPFWTKGTDYIYLNIYNLFKDEQERLNPKYKSDEDIYKKYIVWINNINGKYRDLAINNWYLSNLDLYWITITDSKKIPKASFSTWFWNFIVNIKNNIKEDDINKKNIINTKNFNIDKPIYYKWDEYFYVSDFQASKFRRDIMLVNEKVVDWNTIKKYIILPYYDITSILTNWAIQKDIDFFLSTNNKKQTNWTSDIPKDLKLIYKYLYEKVIKEYPSIVKDTSDSEDYYTLTNFNPTDNNPFSWIDIDRLQYFITYNIAYNNNKYDTNLLLSNSNKELSQIYNNLTTLENNYKVFDKLKLQNIPENFKKLGEANKALQNLRDKINLEYKTLWNKNVKWWVIANVSKMYALNLQYTAYTTSDFMLLGNDKYDKIKKQKGHISLLKQIISNKNSVLNQKELETLNLIESIDKFDKKITKINIVNKNNIIPYTLYGFIKERKKFEISWDSDKILLTLICEKKDKSDFLSLNTGKYRKEILEYKTKIWFTLNDTIVDCNANNKKWAILNKQALKDILYKIIDLKNGENMLKEVSLIPYLSALRDQNENRFFNPFNTTDNKNNFLDSIINLWNYKLVSPLLYYKLLLSDNIDKIPWFFINLYDMKWIVWTPDNAFNFKLGSSKSWYRDLDVKKWNEYTTTLSVFWIPLIHNIVLGLLALLNQFLLNWVFILILSTYIILLKKD